MHRRIPLLKKKNPTKLSALFNFKKPNHLEFTLAFFFVEFVFKLFLVI